MKQPGKQDASTSRSAGAPPATPAQTSKSRVLARDQQEDDELDVLDSPTEIIERPVRASRDADHG